MNILIIGIDSGLGHAVAEKMTALGHIVVGTSRRNNLPEVLYFDLSSDVNDWPEWPDCDVAFIAAAMTGHQLCEDNAAQAQFINVDQTKLLIDQLRARDIHVIFPSTNKVLPCEAPFQAVDTAYGPNSVYAQNKADVERYVSDMHGVTIARFPKIFNGQSDILKNWSDAMSEGRTVSAFSNMYVAPVSLLYAVNFIVKLSEVRPSGVWQISNIDEVSYGDLAFKIQGLLGKHDLVELTEATEFAARHPSLDMKRTIQELGLTVHSIDQMLYDCKISSS